MRVERFESLILYVSSLSKAKAFYVDFLVSRLIINLNNKSLF